VRPELAASLGVAPDSAWLPWLGLAAGLALTVPFAYLLGRMTTRLEGHYLPVATIAWGISLYMVFGNIEMLGGHTGISGLPPLAVGQASSQSPRILGAVGWAILIAAVAAMYNLLDSREGRAVRALNKARGMAESMGVDTARQRLRLFVAAAVLACISGWLYAHLQRFVSPTPFGLDMGVEYLFMTVIGGASYLLGAVIGAFVVMVARHELQDVLLGTQGNLEIVVFGVLMLLALQFYPAGIAGALHERLRRHERLAKVVPHQSEAPAQLVGRKPAGRGTVVLRAVSVSRRFGGLIAVNDASLEVKAGEIHALIGPNGAGKSTLFNLLSGVDTPSAGKVELLGASMSGKPSRSFAAAGLSRTFQHVHLMSDRSALENVALGNYLHGHKGWWSAMLHANGAEEAALRADALWQLRRCGLMSPATPAGHLPLGQQRLLEVARALAAHPLVLLLDEPAAGLRLEEKRALANLLRTLRQEGLAILLVEHDMDFIMNLADTVTVLAAGSVIAHGRPEQVQADAAVRRAYLGWDADKVPEHA
jgi:branched-chain amino acid transport system permease protein